jgi:hypothetical protein
MWRARQKAGRPDCQSSDTFNNVLAAVEYGEHFFVPEEGIQFVSSIPGVSRESKHERQYARYAQRVGNMAKVNKINSVSVRSE